MVCPQNGNGVLKGLTPSVFSPPKMEPSRGRVSPPGTCEGELAHLGQVDHDLDHNRQIRASTAGPHLPLCDVLLDLYSSTDPTPGNLCLVMYIIRLPPGNMS